MPAPIKLENYLGILEQNLGLLSVSDRAGAITKLKSEILADLEKDPNQSLETILTALGEPKSVANRILAEKGILAPRMNKSSSTKWIVIGLLGTLALFLTAIVLIVWRFTPIMSVDEKEDRMSLLGGFIQLDGKNGRFSIGDKTTFDTNQLSNYEVSGRKTLQKDEIKEAKLEFSNGLFTLIAHKSNKLTWNCKSKLKFDQKIESFSNKTFFMDVKNAKGVKCTVELPEYIQVNTEGTNGQIIVRSIPDDLDVKLGNGQVILNLDESEKYNLDLSLSHGSMDNFDANKAESNEKAKKSIKVRLSNGLISHSH